MTDIDVKDMMKDLGERAKAAAQVLATATSEAKEQALLAAADALWVNRAEIIAANEKDLEFGRNKGLTDAMMDRLKLDEPRIQGMIDGLKAIASQKDPVGDVITEWDRPNGLHIKRVRTPLG